MEYLGKSNGTTLREHSIEVSKLSEFLLKESGITDEKLINITKVSALLHDIGKTAFFFQKNIGNQEDLKKYPRHNEIGFALLKVLIDYDYGFYNDRKWSELIQYITLYHHTPFNINSYLNEYFNNNQLNEISDYFNNLLSEHGLSEIVHLKKDVDIDDDDILIGNTKTFDFIRSKEGLNKENIDRLKYFEIIFNIVRYADLIVSGEYNFNQCRPNPDVTYNNLTMPSYFDKERWNEQCDIAKQAYFNNMTIVDATMGWGKTICGVMYLLHSNKKGFWVCPDNTLAQATCNNIKNDLAEIGENNIKVSLILGGKWEENNIEDADIIVTNIDSYVNGIFRNSRKTMSYEALFSNTIFDEYHEYITYDNPIIVRFKTIIEARKLMNNVKTLLLSGTAVNKGYVDVDNVIIADKTGLDKKRKMDINFVEKKDLPNLYKKLEDYFTINTRIKKAQENYDTYNMNYCFHSLFDEKDLTRIIDEIYKHNGKKAMEKPCNVSTTSVYSRGLNLSHKACSLINPMLFMIEQAFGRTGHRWNPEIIAEMYPTISDDPKDTAIYKSFKKYKTENVWDKFYKPFLLHIKKEFNGKTISAYDLKQFREQYAEETKLYKKLFLFNARKGLEELCQIEFSKGSPITEKKDDIQHIKDKIDVRGNSLNRFFTIKKDDDTMTEPMILSYYNFDNNYNDFSSILHTRIIDEVIRYFEKNDKERVRYGLQPMKRYKGKEIKLFNILIDKAKSSEFPFPILCDFICDSNKGFMKK